VVGHGLGGLGEGEIAPAPHVVVEDQFAVLHWQEKGLSVVELTSGLSRGRSWSGVPTLNTSWVSIGSKLARSWSMLHFPVKGRVNSLEKVGSLVVGIVGRRVMGRDEEMGWEGRWVTVLVYTISVRSVSKFVVVSATITWLVICSTGMAGREGREVTGDSWMLVII